MRLRRSDESRGPCIRSHIGSNRGRQGDPSASQKQSYAAAALEKSTASPYLEPAISAVAGAAMDMDQTGHAAVDGPMDLAREAVARAAGGQSQGPRRSEGKGARTNVWSRPELRGQPSS